MSKNDQAIAESILSYLQFGKNIISNKFTLAKKQNHNIFGLKIGAKALNIVYYQVGR